MIFPVQSLFAKVLIDTVLGLASVPNVPAVAPDRVLARMRAIAEQRMLTSVSYQIQAEVRAKIQQDQYVLWIRMIYLWVTGVCCAAGLKQNGVFEQR